jgi:hypothetical protein
VVVASREPVGDERRLETRHAVDVPVTVRAYRVSPIDARMVDLSSGGAMITWESEVVGRGDEILLATHGLELVATIAWATDDFCGLAFHRRLNTAEMAALRKAGRSRAAH